MNARQQKVLARFGQVLTFLDANASVISPSAIASQRQALSAAVAQVTGFAQDQVRRGTEQVLSQSVSSARVALRDTFMRQLSTIGLHSLTGKNPGDPNVLSAPLIFALPATRTNALTLITSAQAMVQAATPYASIFTAAGVNFDAVNAAIQSLQAATNAEGSAKRVSKGATQGITAQIKLGQGAVRMMDVVIRPLLATNKPLLTQWESVKRAAGGVNLGTPVPVPAAIPSPTATTGSGGGASTTPAAATGSSSGASSSTGSGASQPAASTSGGTASTASAPATSAPSSTTSSTTQAPASSATPAPSTSTAAPASPAASQPATPTAAAA